MKKIVSVMLTVFFVAGVFAACGGTDSAPPAQYEGSTVGGASAQTDAAAAGPTEITLLLHSSLQADKTIAELPKFEEANPDIKVKTVLQASSEINNNIAIEFASGNVTFDLANIGSENAVSYVPSGYLVNLDPYIEKSEVLSKDKFLPAFVSRSAELEDDGIWWGLPWRSDIRCLFYNTDYFAEAGLTAPPATWDEMLSYAEKLNTDSHYGAAFPMADIWTAFLFNDFMTANGYTLFDENWEPNFNHPETVQYVDYMKKLMQFSPEGIQTYNHDDAVTAFIQGKAAMHFNFVYAYSEGQDATKSQIVGKVGSAPNPVIATNCTVLGGWGLHIPEASKYKDEAFRLAEFILSPEVEKAVVMNGGDTCPVLNSTFDDPEVTAAFPIVATIKEACKNGASVYMLPKVPGYASMQNILADYLHRAINNDISAQDAFDQAEAEIRAMMAENGYYQ